MFFKRTLLIFCISLLYSGLLYSQIASTDGETVVIGEIKVRVTPESSIDVVSEQNIPFLRATYSIPEDPVLARANVAKNLFDFLSGLTTQGYEKVVISPFGLGAVIHGTLGIEMAAEAALAAIALYDFHTAETPGRIKEIVVAFGEHINGGSGQVSPGVTGLGTWDVEIYRSVLGAIQVSDEMSKIAGLFPDTEPLGAYMARVSTLYNAFNTIRKEMLRIWQGGSFRTDLADVSSRDGKIAKIIAVEIANSFSGLDMASLMEIVREPKIQEALAQFGYYAWMDCNGELLRPGIKADWNGNQTILIKGIMQRAMHRAFLQFVSEVAVRSSVHEAGMSSLVFDLMTLNPDGNQVLSRLGRDLLELERKDAKDPREAEFRLKEELLKVSRKARLEVAVAKGGKF